MTVVTSIGKVLYDAIVEAIGNRPVYSGAAIGVSPADWDSLVYYCKCCGSFSNYIKGWDRRDMSHARLYVRISYGRIPVHLMPDDNLVSGEFEYFGVIHRINGLRRAIAGVGD